jgi:DNA invertase Pin-like site-specific DNA recombinase
VRQSSPHQVLEHRESRERQYALADLAVALGWPKQRVLVIDDDQGQSGRTSKDRPGFQRLVAEVTLGHVGLVLGLEASRLARSSQDWHQLFELCAAFGTLLADEDGVYDARDPNDRLILGLKGMMSEAELLTMRNRLDRGKLHKAQRGELFMDVPLGYVKLPGGGVDLDPDEQARDVVRLILAKFEELGSAWAVFRYLVEHNIRVGQRLRAGARRGQLEWRRLSIAGVRNLLHHPIYAGAYVYGRRRRDPRRQAQGRGRCRGVWVPQDQWQVLLRDRLPAYISWERYMENQERLRRNRSAPLASGTPRSGSALLTGLVVCGGCGHCLRASYRAGGPASYHCVQHLVKGTQQTCHGMSAAPLDELVAAEVLRAAEPAALELSLRAVADVRQERERLERHWQQQLQRARQAAERVERQYQAAEPEDRLVARTLERRWEEALVAEARLREEYDRFAQQQPTPVGAAERGRIEQLAEDIPALWQASGPAERKEVIRCLVERVVVQVRPQSNRVGVTIHWHGGHTSAHQVVRPVRTYEQMDDYADLLVRIRELRQGDYSSASIAAQLNAEGFRPPQRGPFDGEMVRQLLSRAGLASAPTGAEPLEPGEWWLGALGREVGVPSGKLRDWILRGWLRGRQTPVQGLWIAWADGDELQRLKRLQAHSARGVKSYPKELTTPKKCRSK